MATASDFNGSTSKVHREGATAEVVKEIIVTNTFTMMYDLGLIWLVEQTASSLRN